MNKLLYLTVTAPLGQPEAFLIPEMKNLVEKGIDLTIIPIRPKHQVFHLEGANLLPRTIITGLGSWQVWRSSLSWLFRAPRQVIGQLLFLMQSGSIINKMKNLLVFPKALFIASQAKSLGISHIHAHWASTPATCAMVASALLDIGWSFTAHRWDIGEDNLMSKKVKSSSFVRVISVLGREQVIKLAGPEAAKKVILNPMGVELPDAAPDSTPKGGSCPCIAAIGSLTAVKGHCFLLKACRLLADQNVSFKCLIIGDGPELKKLKHLAKNLELDKYIEFTGALPHHKVIRLLRTGRIMLLAHPSIKTADGAHEGVPVTVMEAMACGVPVIVTNTGSITDLVDREAGIIVPPASPTALALAIQKLFSDPALARSLAKVARSRVAQKFALSKNVSSLLVMMGPTAEGEHDTNL